MALRVRWTPIALRDLEMAFEFISVTAGKPEAAQNIVRQIIEGITQLQSFPESGRTGRVKGTRELVVGSTPYIIVYRIKSETLEMLTVLHTSRKWP